MINPFQNSDVQGEYNRQKEEGGAKADLRLLLVRSNNKGEGGNSIKIPLA